MGVPVQAWLPHHPVQEHVSLSSVSGSIRMELSEGCISWASKVSLCCYRAGFILGCRFNYGTTTSQARWSRCLTVQPQIPACFIMSNELPGTFIQPKRKEAPAARLGQCIWLGAGAPTETQRQLIMVLSCCHSDSMVGDKEEET